MLALFVYMSSVRHKKNHFQQKTQPKSQWTIFFCALSTFWKKKIIWVQMKFFKINSFVSLIVKRKLTMLSALVHPRTWYCLAVASRGWELDARSRLGTRSDLLVLLINSFSATLEANRIIHFVKERWGTRASSNYSFFFAFWLECTTSDL